MPAIVAFVGHSNSGKTTIIEKLIRELRSRGYRVATVKHAREGSTFDEPGKDSWRHLQAGSEATIVASGDKMVLIKPMAPDVSLDEIVQPLGEDPDIILVEGFKQGPTPKIEVHRKEIGPPLTDIRKLIAMVTDEPLETKTRQFGLEDIKGLTDFIEQGFIQQRGDRLSLYVNDSPLPLSGFPREIIASILTAVASTLKGVGSISSLKVFLKKQGE